MTPPPLTFSVWLAGIISRWRLVLKVMAGTLVVAALAAIFLPPIYEAHASFVTSSSTSSKMASALGSGAGALSGLASQLGVSAGADPSGVTQFLRDTDPERGELRRRLLNSRFHNPRSASPRDSATLQDPANQKRRFCPAHGNRAQEDGKVDRHEFRHQDKCG